MGRVFTFLLGMIVGGVLMMGTLRYHIVRANDGLHLIPKSSARLTEPYVDIRGFSLADWEKHPALAMAIAQAGKGHLLQDAASETIRKKVDDMFDSLR